MAKKTNKKIIKKNALKSAKLNTNPRVITVKNAEGDPDTTATILIQNKIDYTPKVSVIIPVYNVEQYLRECLDSVVNQTLREIEIICVDDGSTDTSLEILKEYAKKDNRITVITQKNLYAGVARNAGLAVAKGEYLHFVDSDDWVEKDIYQILQPLTLDNTDIILFDSYKVDSMLKRKITWKKDFLSTDKKGEKLCRFEFEKCSATPWGKLYNRKFVINNALFFQQNICCNDIYFVKLSMCLSQKIKIIDKALYNWRFNAKGNTSSSRGYHSDCVVKYAKQLYESLNNRNLFNNYKDEFYKIIISSFAYEYSQCIPENRKSLKQLYNEFLPKEYWNILLTQIVPEISIIVPVYNAENYLKRCLDSILTQSLKNIEVICINDGSSDKSLDILNLYRRMDHRVRIINKENQGAGSARNEGLKIAEGKYITFLDADDKFEVDALKKYLNVAMLYDADIIITKFYYFTTDGNISKIGGHYGNKTICNPSDLSDNLFTISNPVPWNKLYKKSLIDQNSITFPDIQASEDICFCCLCLACAKRIAFIQEPLIYWTYDNKNSLHFSSKDKNYELSYITHVKLKEQLIRLDKYKQNELSFFKSFYHTLRWSLSNTVLSSNYAVEIAEKYMNQLELFRNKYFHDKICECINNLKNKAPIVISLTSYPARINTVNQTIESLLNQSIKADKVILWLAPEQFPNREKDLPQQLLNLKSRGLTIDWYHDIRSYKKLIPTLQKYPDAIIVTADDDIIYETDWLSKLIDAYNKDNTIIWAHRAHLINKKYITNYNKWKKCITDKNDAAYTNFCTTGGGVLYPPHCFYKDVLKEDLFIKLCPTADDIWFWTMLVLNYKKIKVVKDADNIITTIPDIQKNCLYSINQYENDIQLQNIIKYYPKIRRLLSPIAIKPYLLFPYYLLANMYMKWIKLLILKVKKRIKTFLYQHSYRGKMDFMNANFNKIMQTIQSLQNNTTKRIEQYNILQSDVKCIKDKSDDNGMIIKQLFKILEDDKVLYYNQFETITRFERGLCDMVCARNFEERFKQLISGLSPNDAATIVKIIRRLQLIKGSNSKLDLYTVNEKMLLKQVQEFYREILKISDNLYAYKNYLLPINHFEPSVFFYNHGIERLDTLEHLKNKDILDIGGFIGDSVLMLSNLTNRKIYSFEAMQENYDLMLKTIELNNIKNAVPVHAAVGDKNGEIELRFNGSASSQNDIMVKNPEYIEKSLLIKIDDYVQEHNINVGLIKVDIEGAEQSFLRGARKTIEKYKPTLLISIYHNVDDFLDIKPMIESWNLGYKFKIFKPTIESISGETLLICEQ